MQDQLLKLSLAQTVCHYCDSTSETVSIEELADWIDMAFAEHYSQTPVEPDPPLEGWQHLGKPTLQALQEAALIASCPAEDVRRVLEARHFDTGEEENRQFGADAHYGLSEPSDFDLDLDWQNLERELKTGARFFSRVATFAFNSIFGSLDQLTREDGTSILIRAGPEEELQSLFRARVFTTTVELEAALARPDLELASPPPHRARNGRMNPLGIAVFYGATTEQTALDEVRPPVGAHVLTGQFALRKPVTLLDVTAFENVFTEGSIFDPAHIRRRQQAVFFAKLLRRLVRPVMPVDEPLDYITTQALAEYLSQLESPQIDGILYPSAQSRSDGRNVVLFHRCARSQESDALYNKTVRVSSLQGQAYFVFTEPSTSPPPENNAYLDFITPTDHRENFLSLDLRSVKLHRVSSVTTSATLLPILRHRP